jgi:hypothetical protein
VLSRSARPASHSVQREGLRDSPADGRLQRLIGGGQAVFDRRIRCYLTCLAVAAWAAGCGDDAAPGGGGSPSSDASGDGGSPSADAADGGDDAGGSTVGTAVPFCPPAGQSLVRTLQASEQLQGPASVGRGGDWVIANRHAAFVIQAPVTTPTSPKTYYYYGGLPVDAAPLAATSSGCVQTAPDTFGELAFAVGYLDAADFPMSVLRGFRGDKAEVLADGSDGKAAVLRMWGADEIFWLVEMELIRRAHEAGGFKPRSKPLGLQLAIDYILPPDGTTLEMRLVAFNQTQKPIEFLGGTALFPDDSTELTVWSSGNLNVGGFGLQTFVPFVSARGASSWAVATEAQNLSRTNLSGVDALIDLGQMGTPLVVAPKGQAGDQAQQRWWLSVVAGSDDAAVAALQEGIPPNLRVDVAEVRGKVIEAVSGDAIDDAWVSVERKSGETWAELVAARVEKGQYRLAVPAAKGGEPQRLVLRKDGWPSPPPVALPVTADVDFTLQPAARILFDVRDDKGQPIPAKLFFYAQDKLVKRQFTATGQGELRLPPATYDVSVARGFEYGVHDQQFTATAQTSTTLQVTLPHHVDTTGFLSIDGHVHSAPSADSTVPMAMRMVTAAAEGLEVVMNTDHEIITDPAPHLQASGVAKWVMAVPSEELTASSPEHMNLWGIAPDPTHPRGGPIPWYDQDIAKLIAASRARDAQIITLNHPRQPGSCNYLCAIDWDRLTGAPKLTNPEAIGMPKDSTLWSWDFDGVELINSMGNLFAKDVDPKRNGIWDDWMSFLNFGHRIAAVGVTDVHGLDGVGTPRTYIAAPTDDPAQFQMSMAKAAIQGGRALVSAGAFARVSIGGKTLGDTVTVAGGKADVEIEVQGIPQIDVQRIVVWANCDEVASVAASAPDGVVKFKGKVSVVLPKDAHVTVGAFGKNPMPRGFDAAKADRCPRVVTNPIYVDTDGDGKWTPPGGKTCTYTVGP